MPPQNDSDQCALDKNGELRDAKDIAFFHSPSDKNPISLPPVDGETVINETPHGRPQRNRGSGLQDILAAESLDEWGKLDKKHHHPKLHRKRNTKRIKVVDGLSDLDPEDNDYEMDTGDSTSKVTDVSEDDISNGELADVLSSKTVPENVRRAQSRKRKRSGKRASGSDDPQPSQATTPSITPSSSFVLDGSSKDTKPVSNPIYLFYKLLWSAPRGVKVEDGDRFYQSYHSGRKTLRVTKKMRGNLNGLIGNLRSCAPNMFKFFCYLKDRTPHAPLSPEEKKIALGKIELSSDKLAEIMRCQDVHQMSLQNAFLRQQEKAREPWDQGKFEVLLTKWIVASDQPFEEIPSRFTVRRHVMKMGAEGVQEMVEVFVKMNSKVAISLDGWMSSNNYGFLAIVAHYVHPVIGGLEENLIDFRELLGHHTGENIADAVWDTLGTFGIQEKMIVFMGDNASNMDTFVQGIVSRAEKREITIDADWA